MRLNADDFRAIKAEMATLLPEVNPRIRANAIARGLGYLTAQRQSQERPRSSRSCCALTSAAMQAEIATHGETSDRCLNPDAFAEYLASKGFPVSPGLMAIALRNCKPKPGGGFIHHASSDDYLDSRPVTMPVTPDLKAFLAADGPVIEFHPSEKAVAAGVLLKQISLGVAPCFVTVAAIDGRDAPSQDFHQDLREISAMRSVGYGFESARYRGICKRLGLDPDFERTTPGRDCSFAVACG